MAQPGAVRAWLTEFSQSVHAADPRVIAGVVAVLALAAAIMVWRAQRSLKQARQIEDTPTSKARSAPQGYVELEGVGKQMDGPPIVAPLSGISCVWYRYLIEEQVTTYNTKGRSEDRWVTVGKGESTDVFWLEDATGRVAIDPEGAQITPKHKEVWHSRPGASSYSTLPGFAYFMSSGPSANPRRFTEEMICKGERIYALGMLKNIGSHINAPVHEEIGFLLNQWKQNQAALKQRFDLSRDGNIDGKEWMLVRAQARREVTKARTEEQQQSAEPINLLGPTHDRARPYLLSAIPQEYLVKHHRRHAMLYTALFFAVGSAAIWFFSTRFGG